MKIRGRHADGENPHQTLRNRSSLLIVFAVPDFEPAVGGTTRQTGLQARALAARGHHVMVVTRRTSRAWPRRETVEGLEVHRVGPSGRGPVANNLSLIGLALWLTRRRGSIDVLQTVMWADAALAAAVARLLGRTAVLWAIRNEAADALSQRGPRRKVLKSVARRRVHSRCRHIVLTESMRSELETLGLESKVIPVPVDTRRFRPPTQAEREMSRSKFGIPPDIFAVLYVGHLQARKRLDLLISSFAALIERDSRSRLLLVGGSRGANDDVEEQLRRQVLELGIADSVMFFGATTNPQEHYWAADVFVLPSEREGMPNSILEAMCCALPCIAPATAGGAELLDEQAGIVPATNTPDDLVPPLLELRESPKRREKLGRAAHSRASALSIDRVIGDYESVYERIAHNRVEASQDHRKL